MGIFDRLTDEERQERRQLRDEQNQAARAEAERRFEEQRRYEEERRRVELQESERLRQMDLSDGRFDGRPN